MKIQNKLFIAGLLASLVLVTAMLLLMRWSMDRGMLSYVNSKRTQSMENVTLALATVYSEQGDWQWLRNRPRLFHDIIRQYAGEYARELGPPAPLLKHLRRWQREMSEMNENVNQVVQNDLAFESPPEHRARRDENRRHPAPSRPGYRPGMQTLSLFALTDTSDVLVVGKKPANENYQKSPVVLDDVTVGYFFYRDSSALTDGFELSFIREQNKAFLAVALLTLVFAALFSLPLSRHLVNPVRQLASQIRALAKGEYDPQPIVPRGDEIGELSKDLNILSRTLRENETLRQRWVADTSHELRTPVAILRAQLEALLDGVRAIDRSNLDSMHAEVIRLSRLIDDLQQLSMSDLGSLQYRMLDIDLSELVLGCAQRYEPSFAEAGLQFNTNIANGARIVGDQTRLQQLFDNLLSNSLKYTDHGGDVSLSLRIDANEIAIELEDSAPGVTENQLQHLFDYLYRAEKSRNRETGGSGLGLSITKRIVEAHGGQIKAAHSERGGVHITVTLSRA